MIRRVLFAVVVPAIIGSAYGNLVACGPSFEEIERAAAGGDVSAKLAKCRAEARADYYVGQKSVEESMATYRNCLRREGVSLTDGGQ